MKPITKSILLAIAIYSIPSPLQVGLSLYGLYNIYKDTSAIDLKKNLDLLQRII